MMKRTKIILLAIGLGLALTLFPRSANAQILDLIKEATTKVIKAIDLRIQRLQNHTIDLQNVQKQVENLLSKLKLEEIADWTQKLKGIYGQYFDELWRVKSFIAYYKRVTEIVDKQKQLIDEYKRAFALLRNDKHFSEKEIEYIHSIYAGIIEKSIESLDQVLLLVKSFTVQMSDGERLELLNRSADEIEVYVMDMRRFTNRNIQLSLQRAKDLVDINTVKTLYGIE